MPIYEYKCEGCGDVFELRQRFADEPLTTHDKCGAPVHRLISAPALQFKGSGWYVTDYGKGGNSPSPSKHESKSDSSGDSKAESKSDSNNGSKSSASESKPSSSDSSSK